ncbi:MAG: CRISPR-associated endonuclease Cas2 [Negativicutes bacterium]|nr:CRISPR-associated endonuclease Cas2 [Negativicutes bacterium]
MLVIYDVAADSEGNKRRNRMVKELEGYGQRVQYSAFECHITQRKPDTMIKKLRKIIDEQEDSLRIYKLSELAPVITFGEVGRTFPESVIII